MIRRTHMPTVTSKDGTKIAYERSGSGPALILVDGAICFRAFGPMGGLAPLLASNFTIFMYDRRGRGESGDTAPYAVEREVEDIEALINEAGGSAYIYGTSSGAALAMEATLRLGNKVKKLAMYEPPYNSDPNARQGFSRYQSQLKSVLSEGKRGEAIGLFMQLVGTPAEQVEGMKHAPVWPTFESVAPTLAYDAAVLGSEADVPVSRAANVHVPTLLMNGGAGIPFMQVTADALAKAIPNAKRLVLEGQTHDVAATAVAPALKEFFA
jgi:pimeloyl-ACP methyl ester carboxylesterase